MQHLLFGVRNRTRARAASRYFIASPSTTETNFFNYTTEGWKGLKANSGRTVEMTPDVQHCNDKDRYMVMVHNIPSQLHSASLRRFFSDFVEAGSCQLFHYQHRRDPEDAGQESPGDAAAKRCCLVRLGSKQAVETFVAKYRGRRWIQLGHAGDEEELTDKCAVRPARSGDFGNHVSKAAEGEAKSELDSVYMTKKQRRAKAREHSNKILGFLPELCPPQGLPQGNVGTPTKMLRGLVSACKVPQSALKGLGLNLSNVVRRRRIGEFSFDWKKHDSGEVDEEEGAEEWERHEAQHGEVQAHVWERADRLECDFPMFEEECEQTWEKGSSGLVFYTDEMRWDAEHGDFHERTRDGLDVEPGAAEAESTLDAATRIRDDEEGEAPQRHVAWREGAERMWGAEDGIGRPAGRGMPIRAERGLGVAGRGRGKKGKEGRAKGLEQFERDVKRGLAGRLMMGMGWKEGEALGRRGTSGMAEGLAKEWDRVGGVEGGGKSLLGRRGVGFKRSNREEEEEAGEEPEGCYGGAKRRGGKESEEPAERIGSVLDGGAGETGREGGERQGRAEMLGEFAIAEMPGAAEREGGATEAGEAAELGGDVPAQEGRDGTKRVMARHQLERGIFRRGGVLQQSTTV